MQRRIQATLYEQDFGSRDRLAEAAVVLARRHPLIGVGPGYAKELGRIMGWGRIAAHNTYLQVILSFGLLGFLPFLGGFTMILRGAWRVRGSPWGGIWFAILAMTFAFAIVGNMGYNKSFWIILALGANAPLMAVVAGRNRGLVKQTVAPAVRGFRRGSLVCDIPPDDGRTGFKESSSQGGSKCR
jgi:O-antigen ligase